MVYFYHILHTYACQYYLTTSIRIPWYLIDMGLLCNGLASCGQLVKILIALEPYGIFGSNVAYLFILIMSCYPSMQNSGEGLPSIILAGQGILVKMLITLEPHGIF